MREILELGMEARGNFYYPQKSFQRMGTLMLIMLMVTECILLLRDKEILILTINPYKIKVNLKDRNEYANILCVWNR